MPERIGAVITGGDFQALSVLRTLAKKAVPVILLDCDNCIGRYSRYNKTFYKSPDPAEHEAFLDFLIELVRKEGIHGWVLYPNSDNAVYVLSRYKDELQNYYRVTTPGWDVVKNIYVKKNTYIVAKENGIPIPETYYPESLDDLLSLALNYPLVLKPSIRDNFYNKTKTKAYRIDDEHELIHRYQEMCKVIDPAEVLVQQFISSGPNHLYSFCPFFKDGKVIAGITARRARQHPMDFGHASTFAELVDIPELRRIAEQFLRVIEYYGIGEVEFMYDPGENEYKLIEVNPRVWGWHSIAIGAGLDLPYILYLDMIGEKVDITPYKQKLKWVRLTTDTATVFSEILKRKMGIGDYIASMKGEKVFAVLSKDDPVPFFAELAMLPYLWLKRGS